MTNDTLPTDLQLPAGVSLNSRAAALIATPGSWPLVLHTRVVNGTGGGPEKTILHSPRFLNDLGYDCLCVYFRDPADSGFESIEARAQEADAPLVAIDDFGPTDRGILRRAKGLLSLVGNRPLIWHGHDYKSNLVGIWLRRTHRMRIVSTVHGWVLKTWKTPLYYAIDRWSLRRCEAVICVSTDLLETCQGMGVKSKSLMLVDNAIDLMQTRRSQSIAQAKGELGWPESRLLVGAVGRLSPEKGFHLLIDAVAQQIRAGIDVGLSIVGEGPARGELEQQIADLELGDRIHLAGFVADPAMHYQAMDIYALSSLREGLPNVLLEAMAYEVPVVSTRVAGVPRLIDGQTNGRLVDCGDREKLSAAIGELLCQPELRLQLGQAARATVEQRFCFAKRMQMMAAVYDGLQQPVSV
ncbi:2-deoxystreptamine glucosyltransferase [Rosistilla ulvae]|uniref:2-deoxystreptamine glucosyltransferase n=1 Tax=Rosistilla ulvae TaxID=1930277 RepID=A0A517M0B8_9BACT|nr:glycosyltransferase family 4 protein [Rosistilla ulvae]QDS88325.1 2-deoxystreptamine glucosyltransferase [Rosistilla ulvae]